MGFGANFVSEVRAHAGDGIGKSYFIHNGRDAAPFTVLEVIDKHHAKIRIAQDLDWAPGSEKDRPRDSDFKPLWTGNQDVVLGLDEVLEARTRTICAGARYVLRISSLDDVPLVTADPPKVVDAIAAHSCVHVDDLGSVQAVTWYESELQGSGKTRSGHESYPDGVVLKWTGPKRLADEDLQNLAKLNNLRFLDLASSSITDDGLRHLAGLRRLEILNLSETRVTVAGVKKLQQALPKCNIMWTPPTKDERQSPAAPDQLR
jgi:hypothetical protein